MGLKETGRQFGKVIIGTMDYREVYAYEVARGSHINRQRI